LDPWKPLAPATPLACHPGLPRHPCAWRFDAEFAAFNGAGKRPDQILAHMATCSTGSLDAEGHPRWHNSMPLEWSAEQQRFFARAQRPSRLPCTPMSSSTRPLNGYSQARGPTQSPMWPACDAARHGRLPAKGENFYVAEIEAGADGEPNRAGAVEAVCVRGFQLPAASPSFQLVLAERSGVAPTLAMNRKDGAPADYLTRRLADRDSPTC